EVDYLNEIYKVDIPVGENYETLSGFIVNHTEEIPQQGEVIKIDDFEMKILETSNTKIELVELKINTED
ncbi:MAG: transporter associated domain-containing protein, partial [Christiangramia sp.]|nr:transporter associated domain-containing protein [Christiangramia sp.]